MLYGLSRVPHSRRVTAPRRGRPSYRILLYVLAGPDGEYVWSIYRTAIMADGYFDDKKHVTRTIKRLIWNPTPNENCHPWTGQAIAAKVYSANKVLETWIKDPETGRAVKVTPEELSAFLDAQEANSEQSEGGAD